MNLLGNRRTSCKPGAAAYSLRTPGTAILLLLLLAGGFPGRAAQPGEKLWEFSFEGVVYPCPAIGSDGTIYVGTGGPDPRLYALDPATGRERWAYATGGAAQYAPVIGPAGTVYVATLDNRLQAVSSATGQALWECPVNVTTPASDADGVLYLAHGWPKYQVCALDGATGATRWQSAVLPGVFGPAAIGADGTVYVGAEDGRLYALDGTSGARRWEYLAGGPLYSGVAIGADGTVYCASDGGGVAALDGATGQPRWQVQTGDHVLWSAPVLGMGGRLYVAASRIHALNGATGETLWTFETARTNHWSSPAVAADGTVCCGNRGDGGGVYALNGATGETVWEFTANAPVSSDGVAIGGDGTVYVGVATVPGKVYALQGTSGLAAGAWPKFQGNAQNSGLVAHAPAIRRQPERVTWREGASGTIRVAVTGFPAPVCRWFLNGRELAGHQGQVLTVRAVGRADEGVYGLTVSNLVGQVTSAPIVAVVSNVDPLEFPGWRWEGGGGTVVAQRARTPLGPWVEFDQFPPGTSGAYVETNLVETARFYRLGGDAIARFTATALIPGWWYTSVVATRHRIEYVWEGGGWTNWVELTELTLAESPHLFLDTDAFDHPGAVYRTTRVP
ncbi:MAG: PQQ-binding-like beta-propeller repeat protein [Verrucomicrobiales bacterium]|nr:PQQ-binding-like beta-propeller repeat protein [Verrucomicrobiales bacterium]